MKYTKLLPSEIQALDDEIYIELAGYCLFLELRDHEKMEMLFQKRWG